jgi:hypothetical protein
MAPFNEKSIHPPKFKRIKSAIDTPVDLLPSKSTKGEPNELYVAEDGTDIQFWDSRNQRFTSTRKTDADRFLLSTEETEGYFEFNQEFTSSTIRNIIRDNQRNGMKLGGLSQERQLLDGLHAYYELNDTSGTDITERVAGHNGTVSGTNYTSKTNGKIDNAVQMATDTSIDVGRGLHIRDGDFTIAFWFYPTNNAVSASGEQILSTGDTQHTTVTFTSDRKIGVAADDNNGSSLSQITSGPLVDEKWSHIVVQRTGDTFNLLVNGRQVASNSVSGIQTISQTTNEVIGANDGSLDGLDNRYLDEVGVWTRSLSTQDINFLVSSVPSPGYYTTVDGANTNDIVSYYTFDDSYNDKYGNNNGTVNGSVSIVDGGVIGKALDLPGGSPYINVTDAFKLPLSTAFTIAFWINVRTESTGRILECGSEFNGTMQADMINDNEGDSQVGIKITTGDGAGGTESIATSESLSVNQWHHVSFGMDQNGNGFIRVDAGAVTASGSLALGGFNETSAIGGSSDSSLDALLDEVAVWKGARLSDTLLDRFFEDIEPQAKNDFLSYLHLGMSLRSHYSLDGNLSDTKKNYDGTSFTGRFEQGKMGQAARFAGPSQRIVTGNGFNMDTLDFSVAFWVNFSDLQTEQYLIDADNGTNGWSLRLTSGGELQFTTTQGGSSTNKSSSGLNGTLTTDAWYFVALVRRDTKVDMYVYDESSSTSVYNNTFTGLHSGSLQNGTGNTTIARQGTGMADGGKIDSLSIFTSSLPQEEIEKIWNSGEGLPVEKFENWNFLQTTEGMRLNAFAQIEDSYLEYEQDMSSFRNYTISAWVKPENFFADHNPAYLMWIGDDIQMDSPQPKNGYVAYNHVNKTIEINGNNTSHVVDYELLLDYWYHLVLVRDANQLILYIDNKPVLTSTDITGLNSGTLLRIGGGPTNTNGSVMGTADTMVDQVTVFKQPLSQEFLDILYNKGLGMDIGTDIKRLASIDQLSSGGVTQAGDKLLRYLHSYYSFDHKNDPHQRSPLDTFSDWQRDDAGAHDAELVSPNSSTFQVGNVSKLGSQCLQSAGDDQEVQQFLIGAGDPSVDASGDAQSFGLSFWMQTPNTSTGGDMTLYRTDVNNNSTSLYLIQNGGTIKLQKGTNAPLLSSTDFMETGNWHHIVLSYDLSQNKFTLYVDGSMNKNTTVSNTYSYTGGNGAFIDDTSNQISYLIDEFGTWERYALGDTDAGTLYNSGSANNDFIYQLWHYYPSQQNMNMKNHNLENLRKPVVSHHVSTKAYADAGDYLLHNIRLYYNFEDTKDKIRMNDFTTSGASLQNSSGIIQYAAEFTGGSDILDLSDHLHSLTAYDFSFSFFVQLADLSTDQILVHSNDSNQSGTTKAYFQLQFSSANNQLIFTSDGMNLNDGTISSNTDVASTNDVITDNNYHHIVVRRQGQGKLNGPTNRSPESSQPVEIFVDGLKVAEENIPLRSLTTTDPDAGEFGFSSGLSAGEQAPPSTISHTNSPIQSGGLIAEFGVWDRWLDDGEITYLYNDNKAVNNFIDLIWSSFAAHAAVNVNNYQVKNIAAPTDENDAIRLTDFTKWRSGHADVRQTVMSSIVDGNGYPAMLNITADPKTIGTVLSLHSLETGLDSFIEFDNYQEGGTSVPDAYRNASVTVDNTNGDNTKTTSPLGGDAINIQGNNYIELGNRLENAKMVGFWMKFGSVPSGTGEITIMTDDRGNDSQGFRFFYDIDTGNFGLEGGSKQSANFTGVTITQWNFIQLEDHTTLRIYPYQGSPSPESVDGASITPVQGVDNSALGVMGSDDVNIQFAHIGFWTQVRELNVFNPYPFVSSSYGVSLYADFDNDTVENSVGTDLSFTGSPQYTNSGEGVRGKALYKGSDSDYLDIPQSLLPGDNSGIISFWIHLNDTAREVTIANTTNADTSLVISQKSRNISINSGTISTENDPVPSGGGWVHILLKSDKDSSSNPATLTLLVNGEVAGSASINVSDAALRMLENLPANANEKLDLLTIVNFEPDVDASKEIPLRTLKLLYNGGKGLLLSHIRPQDGARSLAPLYPHDFDLTTSREHTFTFGDGIDKGSQVNIGVNTTAELWWTPSSVSANTRYYLYIDYDENTDTFKTGITTLAPTYSFSPPSSPSNGQYWYPVDHRKRGETYDGSNWQPTLRLFVGEALADSNGDFTRENIHTYAYRGHYVSAPVHGMEKDSYITFSHNIGTNSINAMFIARYLIGDEEYDAGDEIVLTGSHNASYATYNRKNALESVFCYQKEGIGNFTKAKGDAVDQNVKWNDLELSLYARRMF